MPDIFSINVDTEQEVALPVGGEDFPLTGFIAQWVATIGWEVGWPPVNLEVARTDAAADMNSAADGYIDKLTCASGLLYDDVIVSRAGDTFNYFYTDQGVAQVCCELLDREAPRDQWPWRPQQVWRFSAPVATLQVAPESREKFSDPLTYSVPIMTMRSDKNRHKYQLMALPAFVAAYAKVRRLNVPAFDLSGLLVPDDQRIKNDETHLQLIGNKDAGYKDSLLWKQRVALWAALGEDDPAKWHTVAAGTKFSTTSARLNEILLPAVTPWTGAGQWARIIQVPNPAVGDDYGIACLTEFFASAEEAAAAAAKDRPQKEGDTTDAAVAVAIAQEAAPPTAPAAPTADGSLAVPAIWVGHEDNWKSQVQSIKADLANTPPPLHAIKIAGMLTKGSDDYLGFELGKEVDVDFLTAWLEAV